MEEPGFIVHLPCNEIAYVTFNNVADINYLSYKDIYCLDGSSLTGVVTWCPNCGQAIGPMNSKMWKNESNKDEETIDKYIRDYYTKVLDRQFIDALYKTIYHPIVKYTNDT